jgi:hypothetical protein
MPKHTCPLCWFSFDTEAELNQHEQMEEAVTWSLDQEPSTHAETT